MIFTTLHTFQYPFSTVWQSVPKELGSSGLTRRRGRFLHVVVKLHHTL